MQTIYKWSHDQLKNTFIKRFTSIIFKYTKTFKMIQNSAVDGNDFWFTVVDGHCHMM